MTTLKKNIHNRQEGRTLSHAYLMYNKACVGTTGQGIVTMETEYLGYKGTCIPGALINVAGWNAIGKLCILMCGCVCVCVRFDIQWNVNCHLRHYFV